ncbi:hypothetical protein MRX96_032014 [Rhipicephalus microplus]
MLIPLLFVIQVALCSMGHISVAGDPASLQVNTTSPPDQCAMDATKLLPPDINESILRRQWRTDTVTSTEGPHLDRINTGRNDGSFSGLGCTREDRMLIPLLFVIQILLSWSATLPLNLVNTEACPFRLVPQPTRPVFESVNADTHKNFWPFPPILDSPRYLVWQPQATISAADLSARLL